MADSVLQVGLRLALFLWDFRVWGVRQPPTFEEELQDF
jgi:hypothetical protein